MAATMRELGIDRMSVEERLALAQDIWVRVAEEQLYSDLTEPQRDELRRRLADSKARPEAVVAWEAVKQQALARARS